MLWSVWLALALASASPAQGETFKTVRDLKNAMYEEMKYSRACVKLLNASGEQGCEAHGQKLVTAPLVHLADLPRLPGGPRVVVAPVESVGAFLRDYLGSPQLRQQIVGVLVDPTTGRPSSLSSAPRFPNEEFMPYSAPLHVWNPVGMGFERELFGIPMYVLTETLANETRWRATYNANHELKGGKQVARMELPMLARGDSSTCIAEDACLPVGGYGVWTAIPGIPDPTYNASGSARPITLVLAQVDSNSLFHDLTKAADTALSGLVSAMVALTLLVRSGAPATYARQLAFAALPGESFGLMGSKRLLYEMSLNSIFTRGLRLDLIDQVLEVGQVGGAWNASLNASSFFLHTQLTGGFGDAGALLSAAQSAPTALNTTKVVVQPASATNPGIPPSSLASFLRVKPSVAGMVLTAFDSAFGNPYFNSEYDDGFFITVQALTDAALVTAQTLHTLAAGPDTPPLVLNQTAARYMVADLVVCLMLDLPGMRCPTAAALMSPDIEVFYDGTISAAVKGYPGVLRWVDLDPRASRSKPNLARFVFNYLGNLTAVPLPATPANGSWEGAACDTTVNVCPWPLVCIGWRYGTKDPVGMGRCRNTSTSYFPVYSTRLWYGPRNKVWRWWVDNSSAAWEASYTWPPDPMWTESNWPALTPKLTVFQDESESTQVATLVAGLLLTAATGVVSWAGLKAFERHLKTH